MERYLPHLIVDVLGNLQQLPLNKPLFHYPTKLHHDGGIYAMLGTDHGKGASQFLLRLNLLPSHLRRKADQVDYRTRTLSFASIICKKDDYPVLQLSKSITECAINLLQTKMLVAVVDEETREMQFFY